MRTRMDPGHSRSSTDGDPRESDHGAWDGPTVGDAPHDAVKGGITTVARGVGASLGAGVTAVVRAGSAVGRSLRGSTRPGSR